MSDPSTYYGGTVFAMKGKDCVALCTDRRLGNGYQTIVMNVPKVEQISKYALAGLADFAPDS